MQTSRWMAATLSLLSACAAEVVDYGETGQQSESLVYGADDRLEYEDVVGTDFQRWADSTAAMVRPSLVSCTGDTCTLSAGTWSTGRVENDSPLNLCADVRFRGQDQLGRCTAFLVGPDLVVSAGHCVDEATDCANNVYVFGYNNDDADNGPASVPAADVYSCAEIIEWHDDTPNGDWSLIRLDRSVRDRVPLNVFGRVPEDGDDLAILGHPSGIPMKISPVGEVTEVSDAAKLQHNVESFSGNSGSPVVNMADGSISAIHTNPPDSHYVTRTLAGGMQCAATRVCSVNGCAGGTFSRATRIAMLSHLIPLTPALSHAAGTALML